jgi:hypothetical protein
MDFETILSILDSTLREKVGTDQANEFLVDFMKRSVATGIITITVANSYLIPYGCIIKQTCWGCREDQPNQLAHIDPGGCLYNSETE